MQFDILPGLSLMYAWRFLYGPRLTPFLRSLRSESRQVAVKPSLMHRLQGLPSSHFLHAF